MAESVIVYGWTGSEYARVPMLWGYGGQYAEHEQDLNTGPADETLTFSTVPAGEVWVITLFTGFCDTANPEVVSLRAVIGGTTHYLAMVADITANLMVVMQGEIILVEDDYLCAVFEGCGLNDKIYADAVGYKMSIT